MKYRKKPVTVEVYKYEGDYVEALEWAIQQSDNPDSKIYFDSVFGLNIRTLEGEMHVSLGDIIICGIDGEFYPCKPDIFERTYERAEDETA